MPWTRAFPASWFPGTLLKSLLHAPPQVIRHDPQVRRVQLLEALSKLDRRRVVRDLVVTAARGDRGVEIRFDLPEILHPETDFEALRELADEGGLDVARLIAGLLDASNPGFARVFEMLSERWGADEHVRRGLVYSTVMIRETYSDKNAVLKPRLLLMNRFTDHDNPRVADIAREARRRLLEEMRQD